MGNKAVEMLDDCFTSGRYVYFHEEEKEEEEAEKT